MNPLYLFFSWLLMGIICSHLANSRGRNSVRWFFVGSFFGLVGLIVLLCLPSKVFVEPPLLIQEMKEVPTGLWYYLDPDSNQHGPMSFAFLKQELEENRISEEYYVWNENWEDWKRIKTAPEFQ